jgi:FtsH-binding integral membrane protein
MKNTLRIMGILLAVLTVGLSLSLLMNEYNSADQAKRSWSTVTMCGALICNGGYYYLKNKHKPGLMMASIGVVILIVALLKFPF